MDLKDRVGESIGPYEDKISAELIESFARAVRAKNVKEAPPTFLTICRKAEFALFDKLGFSLANVLHGEQAYEYESSPRSGDVLSYSARLASAVEKRGMTFMTFETTIEANPGPNARPIGKAITTVILRGGA